MTDTRTVPVADLLESLDFDACCQFGHKPQSEYEPCDSPAIWVTVASCCGEVSLRCDPHFRFVAGVAPRGLWLCIDCQRIMPGDSPMFERYSRIERIK